MSAESSARTGLDRSLGQPDRTGTVRVLSVGSVWLFDGILDRYLRMPRGEAPRERPEWSDERAGPCQDFVWHALHDAWITDDGHRLVVIPADGHEFWGPMTQTGNTLTFDLAAELAHHANRTEPAWAP